MRNRFFPAVLLTLALLLLPALCAAAEEQTEPTVQLPVKYCGENVYWSVDGGTLCISGEGDMINYVDGFQPWYDIRYSITSVVIGDGVTSVGSNAFRDMDGITWVSFGNALKQINEGAFYSCDNLITVSVPKSFREFGKECFASCWKLSAIYCVGYMPKFGEDCVKDTWCKVYYPVNMPWAVSDIAILEERYDGHIEILASDGTDIYHYVPKETEPPVTEETEPEDDPVSQIQPLVRGAQDTKELPLYIWLGGVLGVVFLVAAVLLAKRAARGKHGKKNRW